MRREAPDPRFYTEIRDLNLEFLRLIRDGRRGTRAVFGLDSGVVEQIGRLGERQLESVAAAPCLLASVGPNPESAARRSMIGEPPHESEAHWQEASRIFLASLLTYVWQISRRDPLLAGLCAGRASEWPELLREPRFGDLRQLCDSGQHVLRARFHANARFWPDLVSAARTGDAQRVHVARMSGIQLALTAGAGVAASGCPAFAAEPSSRPRAVRR